MPCHRIIVCLYLTVLITLSSNFLSFQIHNAYNNDMDLKRNCSWVCFNNWERWCVLIAALWRRATGVVSRIPHSIHWKPYMYAHLGRQRLSQLPSTHMHISAFSHCKQVNWSSLQQFNPSPSSISALRVFVARIYRIVHSGCNSNLILKRCYGRVV